MKSFAFKIDKKDNVSIALKDLCRGAMFVDDGQPFCLLSAIPANHIFFTRDLKAGDNIVMYGVIVGVLNFNVQRGERMTIAHASKALEPSSIRNLGSRWRQPDVSSFRNGSFKGYCRSDGSVGTANYWLFIPTVFCEHTSVDNIKNSFNQALGYLEGEKYYTFAQELVQAYQFGEDLSHVDFSPCSDVGVKKVFKNIDGIKFLNHSGVHGSTKQHLASLSRLLAAYCNHPNVAGITVLSFGYQQLQVGDLKDDIYLLNSKFSKPLLVFEQKEYTGEEDMIQKSMLETFKKLIVVNQQSRTESPINKLTIGVKCGANDAFSGISANPAIGHCADLVVALGGKILLAEFPELLGAKQQICARIADQHTTQIFNDLMDDCNQLTDRLSYGYRRNSNSLIIKEGLIVDTIKSTAAAIKGGSSPIVDVLDYAQVATKAGLSLVYTPEDDIVATTAQVAAGATLMLFATGLGTPIGNPICPTVKISSNSSLAYQMENLIDLDAGAILRGEKTIAKVGEEIFVYCIKVASGELIPKTTLLQQDDFMHWQRNYSI